ncbi:MAG: hypothetical protein HQK60_18520 [Deltaproteobacteria bacterium]|nr:hypothetical protein [Deltaproteobacteria bacterium]
MFPFCFEWHWDAGHFFFMGLFYLVLTVVGSGMAYCIVKTFIDTLMIPIKKHEEHSHEHAHAGAHGH